MAEVSIELLGKPAVRRADSTKVGIPTSLQPLLGYLCLEPASSCHRERIVETLWPSLPPSVGRHRLNTVVWRARAIIGTPRDDVLQVSRGGLIRLDRTHVEVDIIDAVRGLNADTRSAASFGMSAAVDLLKRAASVDAQEFLVGCYDDWVIRAREELASLVVSVLETLVAVASAPEEAIAWAELLLRRDPLREDMHRRLIHLYAESGRRSDALRQYDVCRRHLKEDLGVEPLTETSLLAAAVRAGVPPLNADRGQPAVARRELFGALASCRSAVEQIERALEALPAE